MFELSEFKYWGYIESEEANVKMILDSGAAITSMDIRTLTKLKLSGFRIQDTGLSISLVSFNNKISKGMLYIMHSVKIDNIVVPHLFIAATKDMSKNILGNDVLSSCDVHLNGDIADISHFNVKRYNRTLHELWKKFSLLESLSKSGILRQCEMDIADNNSLPTLSSMLSGMGAK